MEREIGSNFEFCGKLLRVEEKKRTGCRGCFMLKHPCYTRTLIDIVGYCTANMRSDNKKVIFKEVKL